MLHALMSAFMFAAAGADPVAAISLYNPTAWQGSFLLEIPTGKIAAPMLLDWRRVRLLAQDRVVPFAIREGRAHWRTHAEQARAAAPEGKPRAEDLLVFVCEVPPGEWKKIDLLEDPAPKPDDPGLIAHDNGSYTITYPDGRASIDESTAQLRELTYRGGSLLTGPLSVKANRLAEPGAYELEGGFGPGYADPADPNAPHVKINLAELMDYHAKLESSLSTAAMTEMNFEIAIDSGPSIALTYRVYANGAVDIVADGVPWDRESPWCNHAVSHGLPLAGKRESLPYLEDRFAFYGFKGYAASVRQAANIWRGAQFAVVELGEEAVNGRRWARRLFPVPSGDDAAGAPKAIRDLVEAMDEGLVVDVLPLRVPIKGLKIQGPETAHVVVDILSRAVESTDDGLPLRLELLAEPEKVGIEGDGFQIRPDGANEGWRVSAGTLNGLYRAANAVASHVARHGTSLPLVSENPVVALRAGGFGGGDFEVDFPYGTEDEWKRVFDNLAASGMNHFACLGMWGNWKMPVDYKYMPEIRSSDPGAYDESSGAKFAEVDQHREKALRLTQFLHDRGAKVWLWIPIGCVPTTFVHAFPEAMAPSGPVFPKPGPSSHSDKIPCFTHPDYRRYLDAFFRELIETYPIDGLVLIRDDNGGLCTCDRCKEYVAASRTKSAAWEQYLVIYDLLRAKGFKGDIAVYPYFDGYKPEIEPLLPKDVYIIGHGGESAVLTRANDHIGLMGDTWLDNVYANFRLPPSPRMRRLLSDRGSFWIGGAYCGTELPWESVGRFGWEPTATPNTLRYEWGLKTFGSENAIAFVRMNQIYEHLWEISARYMPPATWMKLDAPTRARIVEDGVAGAAALRERLTALKEKADSASQTRWFEHMELFAPFFEYHLHRLDLFARIYDLVLVHDDDIRKGVPPAAGGRLPEDARQTILAVYKEIYDWASKYDTKMKAGPDGMLARCRWMTSPYKEWMAGYDQWLEAQLKIKQFAGTMQLSANDIKTGEPFTLAVELRNTGVCPWIPGVGQQLQLSGAAEQLGLPKSWPLDGEWIAPGDSRTIQLHGIAPAAPGSGSVKVGFTSPFRVPEEFVKAEISLEWK